MSLTSYEKGHCKQERSQVANPDVFRVQFFFRTLNVGGPERLSRVAMAETVARVWGYSTDAIEVGKSELSCSFTMAYVMIGHMCLTGIWKQSCMGRGDCGRRLRKYVRKKLWMRFAGNCLNLPAGS